MTTATQTANKVFEMTRSFNAPVDALYRAFTDADALGRWGVGQTYNNLALDMDVREGGVLYHRVRSKEDGSEWTFFGVYHEVQANLKLKYTFDWKTDWREEPTPSIVDLTFIDRGDKAEISILHSGLAEQALPSTDSHWNEFLDSLDVLFAAEELT